VRILCNSKIIKTMHRNPHGYIPDENGIPPFECINMHLACRQVPSIAIIQAFSGSSEHETASSEGNKT
jgi:hypothetical protein